MKKMIESLRAIVHTFHQALMPLHTSPELLEAIFANRNRAYGAYALRSSYNTNMGKSLLFSVGGILTVFAMLSFVPKEVEKAEVEKPGCEFEQPIIEKREIKIIPDLKATHKMAKVKSVIFVPPLVVPDQVDIDPKPRLSVAQVLATSGQVGVSTDSTSAVGAPGTGVVAQGNDTTSTALPIATPVPLAVDEIIDIAEFPAEYPGGVEALMGFLQKNLKYPAIARESGVQGRVYVQFVVETDGSVSQMKVVKDIGAGCGAEALRVLSKMPLWKPAKQGKAVVRMRFTVPVFFKLN